MQIINIRQSYKIYALIFLFSGIIGLSMVERPLSASLIVIFIISAIFLAKIWDRIVWFVVPAFYLGFITFAWPLEKFIFDLPVTTLLVIPAFIHIFALIHNKKIRQTKLNWPLIISIIMFTLYIYLSLLWTTNENYGFRKAAIFGVQAFLPAAILLTSKTYDYSLRHISIALQLIGLLLAIQLLLLGIDDRQYPGRLTLPGINPIWISRIAVLAIIASILNFSLFSKLKSTVITVIVIIASIYIITVTGSRGPALALIVAVIIGSLLSFLNKSTIRALTRNFIVALIFMVILLMPAFIFPDLPSRHVYIFQDPSTLTTDKNIISRIESFQNAVAIFSDHPLIGKGIGGYSVFERDYPHNLILEILAEGGIIGMLLFFCIMINLLKQAEFKGRHVMFKASLFMAAFIFALVSGDLSSNYEWLIIGSAVRPQRENE